VNLIFLPENQNNQLMQFLKTERAKLDYVCFVNELLFTMNNPDSTVALTMVNDLSFILNKVILDNVFRYVLSKNTHHFLALLAHRTFSKDIYINPFYISQVIECSKVQLPEEDKTEIENLIRYRLQHYIDDIYTTNSESINVCLLDIFEMLTCNLGHLNVSYYKFELMDYRKPIILYTLRQNENYLYI
jgi:hypothetical protein